MKFNLKMTVTGMKKSKGTLENGTPFDSTKVYALTDLDDRKGNGMGQATVEYALGKSDEFDKFAHMANSFPLECEAEVEIVTNGKTQTTIINALKPLNVKPAAGVKA